MKEFIFYQGSGEARRFVNRLLDRECVLVPTAPFPIGPYPRLTKALPDEPIEKIVPNLSVLVFGPFSLEEPVVRPLPSGKLARVSVNQGGPMIGLNMPGWWPDEHGHGVLSPGMLSMQPEFWDANLSRRVSPTPQIKKYYTDLVKELKSELVHVDDSWIGEEAIELLRTSKAAIRPSSVGERLMKCLMAEPPTPTC